MTERDVLANVHLREQPQALAVFGDQGDTGINRLLRMVEDDRSATQAEFALKWLVIRAEQAFEQFGPTGPHEARDPHDFACSQRQGDLFESPGAGMARPGE